ncbi:hypothetical protein GOPIP_044_00880 [Gordonia polyisoprenivorans NBRC 16320 = JCM 10675]|uniref:Uncharacterized protein n=1 Tax=Gordonia polyisoprenivorans TaxID=84595 RepID=A0A846WTV3_9ACTN|nr:hypothetical protein [Gordonia polyisoprenivorans]NKY04376.1 hypothetical protein [Gordonia polyisoprenivorans]GAB23396.1 hypothetical protein GOPIP_044_00880 [Gordonia polyisoprenivorans NBRC 16320 = JCM 10675]
MSDEGVRMNASIENVSVEVKISAFDSVRKMNWEVRLEDIHPSDSMASSLDSLERSVRRGMDLDLSNHLLKLARSVWLVRSGQFETDFLKNGDGHDQK